MLIIFLNYCASYNSIIIIFFFKVFWNVLYETFYFYFLGTQFLCIIQEIQMTSLFFLDHHLVDRPLLFFSSGTCDLIMEILCVKISDLMFFLIIKVKKKNVLNL